MFTVLWVYLLGIRIDVFLIREYNIFLVVVFRFSLQCHVNAKNEIFYVICNSDAEPGELTESTVKSIHKTMSTKTPKEMAGTSNLHSHSSICFSYQHLVQVNR